ncbi:mannonate dehydratase [Brachyspira hyodysenteriae]|uniref:Mannonate dehydratase n=1 Tax=Brachyspira hyodysenteriae (strain ATCC 49526 / WA1) TaxID=565034 RepID=UXUA_BRAHW|nr:mannonate dehydratase [Brachyspira hyodysenteriae]C0QWB0.1 RecName: Full=Mannonate dehydratase; AltName: Full=D-mannonate hydro-lyase [Brachyspira hyodysenteriae WA1]ACN84696.1 mannonate dehydratase [Brachyspira hyodysenteriae WA1]KLI48746.1 mannonate dehydratase [Brachyspira hyodysenteriae]
MIMTLRWFGKNFDSVTLKQIRQIPGVKGVITTLYDSKVGDAWKEEDVKNIKKEVEDAGLKIYGIESVNILDDIKIGLPSRDKYIENYIKTLEVLGKEGINLVCYNFMPVFDWTRSDLAKVRPDGSTVLSYDQDIIDKIDPQKMFEQIDSNSNGFVLPGWEPERLSRLKELFEMYKGIDDEKLFENLKYFLTAIMPTCEKYNIKMAIHPDDPAWPVFGLPRIIVNKENILRMVNSVNSPCNGITLCAGSLGSNPKNDIPDIIRSLKGKIFFAHVRNLEHTAPGKFQEAAHLSSDGSMDMFAIMKAFYDIGFEGPFRPDHGRAIWDEVSMPGYGLYDRALGAVYLQGLWEAIEKMGK